MRVLIPRSVALVAAALLLAGCSTQPAPSPSASADELASLSPEVLALNDAFQTAHDDLTNGITAIEILIAEDPTDCRVDAELRIADQLVELVTTHRAPLKELAASEEAGGQRDDALLAKATADLAALQETIDGNDAALATCEKEATS